MKNSFLRYLAYLLIGLSLLSFAGCSSEKDSVDDILVGVLVPTSGEAAAYGKEMFQAYQLACDEINEIGGILGRRLSLYISNDENDSISANLAASKIIKKDVDFVVGGYSFDAILPALQQFYDSDLLTLISCATSEEVTRMNYGQSFMIKSPLLYQSEILLDLCKSLNVKSVAIIHQGKPAEHELSSHSKVTLLQNGIEITTVQVVENGFTDVSSIASVVRHENPDLVFWCGDYFVGSSVITQLRRGGYTGNIATSEGSASQGLIEFCGATVDDVFIITPPFAEQNGRWATFSVDYKSKWEVAPSTYAALAYDTIYVLKNAIETSNSTERGKVQDALQNGKYNGITGLIEFNERRDRNTSNYIIYQIKNGDFRAVSLD